ncbi:aspartate oxidase [Bradyrhizobium sp. JR3.5]
MRAGSPKASKASAQVRARWLSDDPLSPAADPSAVRPILTQGLGVLRDHDGIARAIRGLYPLARSPGGASDAALVGLMIAVAAIRREESRGGHFRTDFPHTALSAAPSSLTRAEALAAVHDIVESKLPARSARS